MVHNILDNKFRLRRIQTMKASALMIFVRNPVLGEVKTRLAATIGQEKALAVYLHLLNHTKLITQPLKCRKFIFYADAINENDLWNGYEKHLQKGEDLGERMKNAFEELFKNNFEKVAIIGSDCYELTSKNISDSFKYLSTNDTVVGPATDGGYYLLGMHSPFKNLFENITWSREKVFAETKKKIDQSNFSLKILPTLNDVDEEKDITFNF